MKKGWKVVLIVMLIAVVLGGVCIGVGSMTGADMDRIYSVLDNRYSIGMYWAYAQEVAATLMAAM